MKIKKKFGRGERKCTADDERSDGKAIGKGSKPKFHYFICDGNHFAKDYLKRENLNAIIVGDGDDGIAYVNLVHVFNG